MLLLREGKFMFPDFVSHLFFLKKKEEDKEAENIKNKTESLVPLQTSSL